MSKFGHILLLTFPLVRFTEYEIISRTLILFPVPIYYLPAPAAPHLPPQCQVHNVFSQPFAQACNLSGHHFMQPHTQIAAPPHHPPHFQHLAQQVSFSSILK